MCREPSTAMVYSQCAKPLNPNAKSWKPDQAQKLSSHTHLIYQDQPPLSDPLPPPPPPPQPVIALPAPGQYVFYHCSPQQETFYTVPYLKVPVFSSYDVQLQKRICHPQVLYSPLIYPSGVDHGAAPTSDGEKAVETEHTSKRNVEGGLKSSGGGREKWSVRFVSPRFGAGSGQGTDFCKKICRREWKPRRKNSDNSVALVGVGGVVPSSPSSAIPPAEDLVGENTTIMIKNIPNQFRRNTLLQILDKYCEDHQMEYDFVYLPFDFQKDNNLGYAFVNFTSIYAAKKISEILNNYKWGLVRTSKGFYQSKKICQIKRAKIQGKEELVRRFQNSTFPCYTREYLPVVLSPPRNGSTSTTLPKTIGKCMATL